MEMKVFTPFERSTSLKVLGKLLLLMVLCLCTATTISTTNVQASATWCTSTICFVNNTDCTVKVYLEYNGQLCHFKTLSSGTGYYELAYDNELWIIKDSDGDVLEQYVSGCNNDTVYVNGSCDDSTPPPPSEDCVRDCSGVDTDVPGMTYLGDYNGSAYYKAHCTMYYHDAKAYVEARGGHLPVINDQGENDFLADIASSCGCSMWTALSDKNSEGNFGWTTGDYYGYNNWNAGEPNNYCNEDYVRIKPDGTWTDRDYCYHFCVVMEVECPCEEEAPCDLAVAINDFNNLPIEAICLEDDPFNFPYPLTAVPSGASTCDAGSDVTYLWNNGETTAQVFIERGDIVVGGSTTFTVEVTDCEGCTATQTLVVETPEPGISCTSKTGNFALNTSDNCEVKFVKNNLDSENVLKIQNLGNCYDNAAYELRIVDVNGQLMYQSTDAIGATQWNGTMNGTTNKLPSGMYFYQLFVNGADFQDGYRGSIALVK